MASVIGRKDPLLRLTVEERYWLHKLLSDGIFSARERQKMWMDEQAKARSEGQEESADSYGVFIDVEVEMEAALRSVSAALDVLQTRMLRAREVRYRKRWGGGDPCMRSSSIPASGGFRATPGIFPGPQKG